MLLLFMMLITQKKRAIVYNLACFYPPLQSKRKDQTLRKTNKPTMQTMQKTCSLNHSKLQYCAKVMQVNFNKSLGFWGLKKSRLKQYFNEFSLHYIFVVSTYDVPPCESRWLQISDGDEFSYLCKM